MKKVKIFLASSSELVEDRREFELLINRKNKDYVSKNIFLELIIWEDFIDAMSITRLQDEYNKVIQESDIFVSLFYAKVGRYTEEEFVKAYESFKNSGKPLIYTYFKDKSINLSKINTEILSLLKFKQKLDDLGHFYTLYTDINDLKFKFSEQLIKLLPSLVGFSQNTEETNHSTSKSNTIFVTGSNNIIYQDYKGENKTATNKRS